MEGPKMNPEAQTLSQSSINGGRSSNFPTSPEFEFWMVRNPSFPQPNLLSADELIVDGVLLPLHLLPQHNTSESTENKPKSESEPPPEPDPRDGPKLLPESTSSLTASKRWNIFKRSEKKNASNGHDEREKEKKKEKKNGTGSTSAELNINIWPFSRSRSAGNAVTRPKMFAGGSANRKVNSAPCSRSNSAGESKSRKWPNSPNRAGVHLGRTSPVWQVRRGTGGKTAEPPVQRANRKEAAESNRSKAPATCNGSKVRVLNLNVPMCIGYRSHLSCRSDETSALGVVGSSGDDDSVGNNGNSSSSVNLFSIRSLFTKKVH